MHTALRPEAERPAPALHSKPKTQQPVRTQMKLKHLFTALFAAAALAFPAMAEDETPLGKEMEKVSKGLKLVNRNLADPAQKDANIAKLGEVKAALQKAVDLEPAKAKDVPAGEKAKFIADYK